MSGFGILYLQYLWRHSSTLKSPSISVDLSYKRDCDTSLQRKTPFYLPVVSITCEFFLDASSLTITSPYNKDITDFEL